MKYSYNQERQFKYFVLASGKNLSDNLCVNVSVVGCSYRSEESEVEVLLPVWAMAGQERGGRQHQ